MPAGKGLAETVLLNQRLNLPSLVRAWAIIEPTTKRKKEEASSHNKHCRKKNKPAIPQPNQTKKYRKKQVKSPCYNLIKPL